MIHDPYKSFLFIQKPEDLIRKPKLSNKVNATFIFHLIKNA